MIDFEKELDELEKSLIEAEKVIHEKADMPNTQKTMSFTFSKYYLYGIAVLIPVLLTGVLYMTKPKIVMKKNKILWNKVAKWVGLMTVILWALLFGGYYYYTINN
jgi:hypothetical protein